MKQVIGAQGEVVIVKIDKLPEGLTTSAVERTDKGWIISHSEKGHHHILTDGEVMERTNVPAGMQILYALLDKPAQFIQDADEPHGHYDLDPGVYEFRISREFDPYSDSEMRRVLD